MEYYHIVNPWLCFTLKTVQYFNDLIGSLLKLKESTVKQYFT